jgi:hypothetical protein
MMKNYFYAIILLILVLFIYVFKTYFCKNNYLIYFNSNLYHERSEYKSNYQIFLDSIHAKVIEDLAFDSGKRDAVIIRKITFMSNFNKDIKITNFGEEILDNADKSALSKYIYQYIKNELSEEYSKKMKIDKTYHPESDVRIFKDSIASGPVFTILGSKNSDTFSILSLEIQP